MRSHSLLMLHVILLPCSVIAGTDDLICEGSGIAGVQFGQPIEKDQAVLVEAAASGVSYYVISPRIEIDPFERLIVGVTPRTRRVFSITLERHGEAAVLDQIIEARKTLLSDAIAAISWRRVGNHHYGEDLEDLNVSLYRIGDFVDGQATHLLYYDCESRSLLREVFNESR